MRLRNLVFKLAPQRALKIVDPWFQYFLFFPLLLLAHSSELERFYENFLLERCCQKGQEAGGLYGVLYLVRLRNVFCHQQ